MRTITVYALASSRDDEVRYIGQTVRSVEQRLQGHKCTANHKCKNPVHKWMKREIDEGFEIMSIVLDSDAIWHETEMAMIAKYRADGVRLLNLTDGGEGILGFTANKGIKRPYLSERNRQGKGKPNGRPLSSEALAKLMLHVKGKKRPWVAERNRESKVWLGRKHTEETKIKQGNARRGRTHTKEAKAKMRASRLGKKASEETKAKMRKSQKARQERQRNEEVRLG